MGEYLADILVSDQSIPDSGVMLSGDENVKIAHRVAPAAITAGHYHPAIVAKVDDERPGFGLGRR
jgi:hypothetical protein